MGLETSLAVWTKVNFIQEQKQSTLSNICLHNFPIAPALQLAHSKEALTMADVQGRADGWIPLKTLQNFLQRFSLVQGNRDAGFVVSLFIQATVKELGEYHSRA